LGGAGITTERVVITAASATTIMREARVIGGRSCSGLEEDIMVITVVLTGITMVRIMAVLMMVLMVTIIMDLLTATSLLPRPRCPWIRMVTCLLPRRLLTASSATSVLSFTTWSTVDLLRLRLPWDSVKMERPFSLLMKDPDLITTRMKDIGNLMDIPMAALIIMDLLLMAVLILVPVNILSTTSDPARMILSRKLLRPPRSRSFPLPPWRNYQHWHQQWCTSKKSQVYV
jgi:hypothetical protein